MAKRSAKKRATKARKTASKRSSKKRPAKASAKAKSTASSSVSKAKASKNSTPAAAAKQSSKAAKTNSRSNQTSAVRHPILALRQEIDRLFDDFSSSISLLPFGRRAVDFGPFRQLQATLGTAVPVVDLVERDREYKITAELPGIDESNLELSLNDNILTIKGQKKEEKQEKKKDYYLSERRYGSFQRSFQLPDAIKPERISAGFRNGVLTVTVPKAPKTDKKTRKISIAGR